MDKLIAAANGKSASQGGLNLPEIKAYLASQGASTAGSGTEVRARLATLLGAGAAPAPVPAQAAEARAAPPRAIYVPRPGNLEAAGAVTPKMLKQGRLSAGEYHRTFGDEAIGDICNIRGDGELKCLIPRVGSVYWTSPTKAGKEERYCGPQPWREKCRV